MIYLFLVLKMTVFEQFSLIFWKFSILLSLNGHFHVIFLPKWLFCTSFDEIFLFKYVKIIVLDQFCCNFLVLISKNDCFWVVFYKFFVNLALFSAQIVICVRFSANIIVLDHFCGDFLGFFTVNGSFWEVFFSNSDF